MLECDVLALLAEEAAQSDLPEPSSVRFWLWGLFKPEDKVEDEAVTARAIAVTEAGSCSGGECCHRWSGFMCSKVAGVPLLCGMSMALVQLRTPGEVDRGATTLPRRRALASQLVIWVLLRPVCLCNISFSSSVG